MDSCSFYSRIFYFIPNQNLIKMKGVIILQELEIQSLHLPSISNIANLLGTGKKLIYELVYEGKIAFVAIVNL